MKPVLYPLSYEAEARTVNETVDGVRSWRGGESRAWRALAVIGQRAAENSAGGEEWVDVLLILSQARCPLS